MNTESFHLADDGRTPVQAHEPDAQLAKFYADYQAPSMSTCATVADYWRAMYEARESEAHALSEALIRARANHANMLAALQCASNVLFLLADEVQALGHNAGNVGNMVRAAIEAATGETKA